VHFVLGFKDDLSTPSLSFLHVRFMINGVLSDLPCYLAFHRWPVLLTSHCATALTRYYIFSSSVPTFGLFHCKENFLVRIQER